MHGGVTSVHAWRLDALRQTLDIVTRTSSSHHDVIASVISDVTPRHDLLTSLVTLLAHAHAHLNVFPFGSKRLGDTRFLSTSSTWMHSDIIASTVNCIILTIRIKISHWSPLYVSTCITSILLLDNGSPVDKMITFVFFLHRFIH